MAFRLYCVDDESIFRDFEDVDVTLGRRFATDMYIGLGTTIPDMGLVSRRHVRIYYDLNGDLGSGHYLEGLGRNGTSVDSKIVDEGEYRRLNEGSVIRFGGLGVVVPPAFWFSERGE